MRVREEIVRQQLFCGEFVMMQGTASSENWEKLCPRFAAGPCDGQQGELRFVGVTGFELKRWQRPVLQWAWRSAEGRETRKARCYLARGTERQRF